MPELILVRGLSGSGKSTLAAILSAGGSKYTICEADRYFFVNGKYKFSPALLTKAHAYCLNKATEALKGGLSIIVSNTTCTEEEVLVYHNLALKYGATFFSLVLENRHGNKSDKNIPEETIIRREEALKASLLLR